MAFDRFLKKRKRLLAFFCLINFCTGGLYVWSILAGAFAEQFSSGSGTAVSAADLGPIFGLASALTPVLMIVGGIVNDRLGPKFVIGAGGVLIAAGYLLSMFAQTPGFLYVSYGLFIGAGTGLVNGCTINTAVKYFPDRRGFAGGVVTASLGVGAALLPFAANAGLHAWGLSTTLAAFAVFSAALIVPLSLLTQSAPKGFAQHMAASAGMRSVRAVRTASKNWREMIMTPTFLPLLLCFMTSATLGLMLISNASGIAAAQIGLTAQGAAAALSLLSAANTAGRFLSGSLSDVIGRLPALFCALGCALAGVLALICAGTGDAVLFFAGLAAVGICFGAFIGIYPGLIADEYGPAHNSVNTSICFLGYSIGGFIGPWLVRQAGASGSFQTVYVLCAGVCIFGALCALIYVLLKRREQCRTAEASA